MIIFSLGFHFFSVIVLDIGLFQSITELSIFSVSRSAASEAETARLGNTEGVRHHLVKVDIKVVIER